MHLLASGAGAQSAPPLLAEGETFSNLEILLTEISWTRAVHSVSWDGDDTLATGSGDGAVRLWDLTTGRERWCLWDHRGAHRPLQTLAPIEVTVRPFSLPWEGMRLSRRSLEATLTNTGRLGLPPVRLIARWADRTEATALRRIEALPAGKTLIVSFAVPEEIDLKTAAGVHVAAETLRFSPAPVELRAGAGRRVVLASREALRGRVSAHRGARPTARRAEKLGK